MHPRRARSDDGLIILSRRDPGHKLGRKTAKVGGGVAHEEPRSPKTRLASLHPTRLPRVIGGG